MTIYYMDQEENEDGKHEIHVEDCEYAPHPQNAQYIGNFDTCHVALVSAMKYQLNVDGCSECCEECHTG